MSRAVVRQQIDSREGGWHYWLPVERFCTVDFPTHLLLVHPSGNGFYEK
jgi:hypothetical protein